MNKWLDEVTEALNQGAPVPDQPEDPEIVYPGYREDNDTSEDAPGTAENKSAPSVVEAPLQAALKMLHQAPPLRKKWSPPIK